MDPAFCLVSCGFPQNDVHTSLFLRAVQHFVVWLCVIRPLRSPLCLRQDCCSLRVADENGVFSAQDSVFSVWFMWEYGNASDCCRFINFFLWPLYYAFLQTLSQSGFCQGFGLMSGITGVEYVSVSSLPLVVVRISLSDLVT